MAHHQEDSESEEEPEAQAAVAAAQKKLQAARDRGDKEAIASAEHSLNEKRINLYWRSVMNGILNDSIEQVQQALGGLSEAQATKVLAIRNDYGLTPLHEAANGKDGNPDICEALIAAKADPNAKGREGIQSNASGQTVLHIATLYNNLKVSCCRAHEPSQEHFRSHRSHKCS